MRERRGAGARPIEVLVVGNYPPPYGGIAVQIEVLTRRLQARPEFACRVLDIGDTRMRPRPGCLSSRNVVDFARKLARHAAGQWIVHVHTNGHNVKSWVLALACALAGLLNGRKTVLTIGSGLARDYIRGARLVKALLVGSALRLSGAVICRNRETRDEIVARGVRADRVDIAAGFYGLCPEDVGEIPREIQTFLEPRGPVVAAMASAGPEYGIRTFLEAVARVRSRFSSLGVLLIGPGEAGLPLGDGVHLTGALPHAAVLAVMLRLSLFVRPTYFDGDASSVREALALGIPVVASDTDFRPAGVRLFRRGDAGDLADTMIAALGNGYGTVARPPATVSDALDHLCAIYRRLEAGTSLRGEAR